MIYRMIVPKRAAAAAIVSDFGMFERCRTIGILARRCSNVRYRMSIPLFVAPEMVPTPRSRMKAGSQPRTVNHRACCPSRCSRTRNSAGRDGQAVCPSRRRLRRVHEAHRGHKRCIRESRWYSSWGPRRFRAVGGTRRAVGSRCGGRSATAPPDCRRAACCRRAYARSTQVDAVGFARFTQVDAVAGSREFPGTSRGRSTEKSGQPRRSHSFGSRRGGVTAVTERVSDQHRL
jgi:hypothetical protein